MKTESEILFMRDVLASMVVEMKRNKNIVADEVKDAALQEALYILLWITDADVSGSEHLTTQMKKYNYIFLMSKALSGVLSPATDEKADPSQDGTGFPV